MELIRVQDSDYRKTYELYMTFPENENGYMNSVYGYNYEQFLEWIEKKRNWSLGKELPEGLFRILHTCLLMKMYMWEYLV